MNIYPLFSITAAIICYFFAILVLLKGSRNKQNFSFFVATLLTGTWTLFPFLTSLPREDANALLTARALYFFASFVPVSWFYFAINFLKDKTEDKKLFFFTAVSLIFASLSSSNLLITDITRFAPGFFPEPGPLFPLFIVYFSVLFGYILFTIFSHLKERHIRGYQKSQTFYILLAFLTGSTSGAIHFFGAYLKKEPIPHDIFVMLYPLILAYAILKYRLMDIKVTITRTGIFIGVYTLVLGLPFICGFLNKDFFLSMLGENWWTAPLLLMALLATIGPFAYIYLQKRAEALLLKEQYKYQALLQQTAKILPRIRNPKKLFTLIAEILTRNKYISHSAIYILDPKNRQFTLKAECNFKKTHRMYIRKDSRLIEWFRTKKEPLLYEEVLRRAQENKQPPFKQLAEEIRYFQAILIIPSYLENKLLALIMLGEKYSGTVYSPDDLNIFSLLAAQAALSIENALLYENIENQIKQRTDQLVAVQKQLIHAEKLATMGTLAGGVAHEINNPLTAILTNIQMLLSIDDSFDADTKESLELIEEATQRCRTIVQKLMAYAKKPLESTELSKVNLSIIAGKAISFLKFQLKQENIELKLETPENNLCVMGDSNELSQVITNMILNARDAIKLVKKHGTIQISVFTTFNWANIRIKDDGAGMTEQTIQKIFDPFYTTKDVGKGLGLGLAICLSIIEKHNGVITVQSEPDKGTVFTIKIPKIKEESILKTLAQK